MRLGRGWGRPLRRGLFGPIGGAWGAGRPWQMLQHANALMAAGQPGEAAGLYDQLAQMAEARAMPKRAAQLNVQAARAWLAAGDPDAAAARARRGLGAFIALGYGARVAQLLPEVVARLREHGYTQVAAELERDMQAQLSRAGIDAAAVRQMDMSAPRHASLPGQCPDCGGPLRSNEIEWIDATSAECPYCGTIVKAT